MWHAVNTVIYFTEYDDKILSSTDAGDVMPQLS